MNNFNKFKIFGRKKGKKKSNVSEIYLKNYLLDLDQDLQNKLIVLDIGSGNGESTLELAKKFKNKLIIASDVFEAGNINLSKQLNNHDITNVKIFDKNVLIFIDKFINKVFLDEVWILFPDPWPKKKHYKRRLINENFLKKIYLMLGKNNKIYIATDSISYLLSILYVVKKTGLYKWDNDRWQNWQYSNHNLYKTRFYEKSLKASRKSFFLILSKI